MKSNKSQYDIAAYIWPAYHYEPMMEHFWPEKDGEWYTVKRATPRFEGHDMPKIPLLGYQDEADPEVMKQHVKLGAEYGVNTFIMDWYWYDNKPCFERQLNDGLIPALRDSDSKFYLMWANHDANTLWDMHTDEQNLLYTGQVDRKNFEIMAERIITKYFLLDSYYRIDNKPVFSIFAPTNFVVGLGGISDAKEALDWWQERALFYGLPGIHIQFIIRSGKSGGPEALAELSNYAHEDVAQMLDIDSGTIYQFIADSTMRDGDYVQWAHQSIEKWAKYERNYTVYFPHVSIGWDNTQRTPSLNKAVVNATPDAFAACLYKAKQYVDDHPNQPPLITINSWNEWTEGSYLLPDMRWGYSYLEAVKKVFCK